MNARTRDPITADEYLREIIREMEGAPPAGGKVVSSRVVLDRRGFLKLTGLPGGGLVLAFCTSAPAEGATAGAGNHDGRSRWTGRYAFGFGGATGARTPDLLHAMQMLSQLSYRPSGRRSVAQRPRDGRPLRPARPRLREYLE